MICLKKKIRLDIQVKNEPLEEAVYFTDIEKADIDI